MVGSSDVEKRHGGLLKTLVIMAIILFLVAITAVLMSLLESPTTAKTRRAREDCKAWATAVERFKAVYGNYPSNLEMLTLTQPGGIPPFMEAKSLCDPWGHQYMYHNPGQHNHKPDIYSWGPRLNDASSVIGDWDESRSPNRR
jgi:general secretion pathway protein G